MRTYMSAAVATNVRGAWLAVPNQRAMDGEDGFTLVELMIVLLIMGLLVGLGLPSYLGVKGRFQDRAAQAKLRTTVLAARILFTDTASFATSNATPGQLDQIDPSGCYVGPGTASVATGAAGTCVSGANTNDSVSVLGQGPPNPNRFAAAKMSPTNTCFLLLDTLQGTFYGTTATPANCTANHAASGVLTATSPSAGGW
jgi:prepilin-type N-terminal cleavage/methylation domain-containing protein